MDAMDSFPEYFDLPRNFKRRLISALLLAYGASQSALACTPPPQEIFASTEKRVRERYALAESIELATIVDVQPISEPDEHGNTLLKGERVTFKIDRIFKGRAKPGDKIIVESTGMCDYSVAGNAALKTNWSLKGGVIIPPRQWLLYRQANSRIAITDRDMARPINEVGFDLQLLERWRKQAPK
jgi:hypothetical protein